MRRKKININVINSIIIVIIGVKTPSTKYGTSLRILLIKTYDPLLVYSS